MAQEIKSLKLYRGLRLSNKGLSGAKLKNKSILSEIEKAKTFDELETAASKLITSGLVRPRGEFGKSEAEFMLSAQEKDQQRLDELNAATYEYRVNDKRFAELKNESHKLSGQINQLSEELRQLQGELDELKADEDGNREEIFQKEKEIAEKTDSINKATDRFSSLSDNLQKKSTELVDSQNKLSDIQSRQNEELGERREQLRNHIEQLNRSIEEKAKKYEKRQTRWKNFWKLSLKTPIRSLVKISLWVSMPLLFLALRGLQALRTNKRDRRTLLFSRRAETESEAFERQRRKIAERGLKRIKENIIKIRTSRDLKEGMKSAEKKPGTIALVNDEKTASGPSFNMEPDGTIRSIDSENPSDEMIESLKETEKNNVISKDEALQEYPLPTLTEKDKAEIANRELKSAMKEKGETPFLAQNANGRFYTGASQVILRADIARRDVMPFYVDKNQIEEAGLSVRGEGVDIYVPSTDSPTLQRKKVYNIEDTDFKEKFPEIFNKLKEKINKIKDYQATVDRSINRLNGKSMAAEMGVSDNPELENLVENLCEASATYDRDYFERELPEKYEKPVSISENADSVESYETAGIEESGSVMEADMHSANKVAMETHQRLVDIGILDRRGGFNFDGMVTDADIEIKQEAEIAEAAKAQRDSRLETGQGSLLDAVSYIDTEISGK